MCANIAHFSDSWQPTVLQWLLVAAPQVTVVAGLIEREGRVLICQRRPTDRYPLKWEFPGGKVEPGEAPAAALARELREELSIRATVGAELLRYRFRYPRRPSILLIFCRVEDYQGRLRNRQFARMLWEAPARLPGYNFVAGDAEFVRRLARGRF
jgi:8-oxo-dGTP diphosphatase